MVHLNRVMVQVIFRILMTLVVLPIVLSACVAAGFLLAQAWASIERATMAEFSYLKRVEDSVEPEGAHSGKMSQPLRLVVKEPELTIARARDVCDRFAMLVRLEVPCPSPSGEAGEGWERVLRTSGARFDSASISHPEGVRDDDKWVFIGADQKEPALSGRDKRPEQYRVLSASRERSNLSTASSKGSFPEYKIEPSPFFSDWPRPVLNGVKGNYR